MRTRLVVAVVAAVAVGCGGKEAAPDSEVETVPPASTALDVALSEVAVSAGFGGLWWEGNTPHAWVTDLTQEAAARAALSGTISAVYGETTAPAEIQLHQGKYTFGQLRAWQDRISAAGVGYQKGVNVLDIDERNNRLTVGVAYEGQVEAVQAFLATLPDVPTDAVSVEVTGESRQLVTPISRFTNPYAPAPTLQQGLNPVMAGMQIQPAIGNSWDVVPGTCTLGYVARGSQKPDGFITASHCSTPGVLERRNWYRPDNSYQLSWVEVADAGFRSGWTVPTCPSGHLCKRADISYWSWVGPSWLAPPREWPFLVHTTSRCAYPSKSPCGLEVNQLMDRVYLVAPAYRAALRVGETVCKTGRTTGKTCGPVAMACSQEFAAGPAQTYTCAYRALLISAGGDSGAPVYLERPGYAEPVGILSGGSNPNAQGLSEWTAFTLLADAQAEIGQFGVAAAAAP